MKMQPAVRRAPVRKADGAPLLLHGKPEGSPVRLLDDFGDTRDGTMPLSARIEQLEDMVRKLQRREELLMRVLDRLPVGVVVVDRHGQEIASNRYAQEVFGDGDGLALGGDGLRADRTEETVQLRQCLSETTADNHGRDRRRGRVLSVTRPSQKRALSLVVTPLHTRRDGDGPDTIRPSGCAAVFIADPERSFELSHERLRRLYALTRAEGQVAACLADGKRLDEAAAELGITLNTARSHLKRIFVKTGTERQGELTQLLQSLLGKIRLD
ncbi:MAG: helix-turn-helix transcriptional regulator [Rhodospirillales bacterium]